MSRLDWLNCCKTIPPVDRPEQRREIVLQNDLQSLQTPAKMDFWMISMRPNKPDRPIVKPQSDRFIELARELGCDEDEAAFKAKLRQIARQKPKDDLVGETGGASRKKPG